MRRLRLLTAICMLALLGLPSANASPLCGVVPGVDDLCPAWSAVYDVGAGGSYDMGFSNEVSPDGTTVYSAGRTWDPVAEAADWITVAYDAATGAQRWAAVHDSEGDRWDWTTDLVLSPDGQTVYVAGTFDNEWYLDGDYAVVAYDAATGAVRWQMRYSGSEGGEENPHALAISPDGTRLYLTGRSGADHDTDFLTVAVDTADGSVPWADFYAGAEEGLDMGVSIVVHQDSPTAEHMVYVTGLSREVTVDFATIAYRGNDGSRRWVARHDGGLGEDNGLYSAVSPDGSRLYRTGDVTVGNVTGGYDYDWRTQALDTATGAIVWSTDYTGPSKGLDRPFALALSPGGAKVFATGLVTGAHQQDKDISVVAYDAATGVELWNTRTGTPHAGSEWGLALAVRPDESLVAMGGVRSTGSGYRSDAVAELYDTTTGERVSASNYFIGPLPTEAAVGRAVAFDPGGARLFLTGYGERYFDGATTAPDHDLVTVAYDLPQA